MNSPTMASFFKVKSTFWLLVYSVWMVVGFPALAETQPIPPPETAAVEVPASNPLPEAPVPVSPPQTTDEAPATPVITKKTRSKIPQYQRKRPKWGFELASSLNSFGGQALASSQGSNPATAFSIQVEYQPPMIQDFGVLGIGPSLAAYPVFKGNSTSSFFSIWSAGAQVRYQARYFNQQPLVPTVSYNFEYISYSFKDGTTGQLFANGPVLGLWLFLNFLDNTTAADFYVDSGVLRTYLIFEARLLSGSNSTIAFNGPSYYFGLRCEF